MIYVVQQGDTLAGIAQEFGVSVARLRSDNGLLTQQPLVPGQALVILIPAETYEVQPGDDLFQIAGTVGVDVLTLLQYNPVLAQGQPIQPGQLLTVRLRGEAPSLGPFAVSYTHLTLPTKA